MDETVTVGGDGGGGGGTGPCDNAGGDSDNDGVCDNDDCAPNDASFPATPGTACNDGDANTTNDQVTADGCGCAGTPNGGGGGEPDCADIQISTDNGKITITGLTAPVTSVQIFTSTWQQVSSCFADCGDMVMETVPAGDYLVYVKFYTAGYALICQVDETVTVGGGGGNPCADAGGDSDEDGVCDNDDCQPNDPNFPATPGTPCNDGNPDTENDKVTASGCGCAGTPIVVDPCANAGGDSDDDGVCDNDDCQPNNPNFPATPGTPCNDGDPATTNDVVTDDGCGCIGVIDEPCFGAGGDSDNDGVCNDNDCQPNNPNFPATPGTACNDGDATTENDQVTADGCGCAGTPIVVDPCANGGAPTATVFSTNPGCGQANGKIQFQFPDRPGRTGIEFSRDGGQTYPLGVADNIGSAEFTGLPAGTYSVFVRWGNNDCPVDLGTVTLDDGSQAPGTACNDGDPNTENDVIGADGCSCAGTPTGPEVCDVRGGSPSTTCTTGAEPSAYFAENLFSGISEGNRYNEQGLTLTEFVDGTALLTGQLTNIHNPNVQFDVHVTFSGRTGAAPVGSPKQSFCGYTIPANNDLYYYTQTGGTLKGKNAIAGLVLNVSRKGEAFQIGTGANLYSATEYGASGWLEYSVASPPNNGAISVNLNNTMDFNFRLGGGQPDCPVDGGGPGGGNTCQGLNVLFVVSDPHNLTPSDAAAFDRLKSIFGAGSVMLKDDNGIQTSDANGKDLVVISASVHSGNVGNKFTHLNVGIVTWESWLYDDLYLTGNTADWEYGEHFDGTSQIVITNAGHPLAAGLPLGAHEVLTTNGTVRWGKPKSHAARIGRVNSTTGEYMVFGYEAGQQLFSGTAAGRRVGLFFDANFHHATNKGKLLFDAAVIWAAQCSTNLTDSDATNALQLAPNGSTNTTAPDQPTAQLATATVTVVPAATDVRVFPNPVRTELHVDLTNYVGTAVHLEVFDAYGRALRRFDVEAPSTVPFRLAVDDFQDGTYLLRVRAVDGRRTTQRFVVVRL